MSIASLNFTHVGCTAVLKSGRQFVIVNVIGSRFQRPGQVFDGKTWIPQGEIDYLIEPPGSSWEQAGGQHG